jgi:hypothetical protein
MNFYSAGYYFPVISFKRYSETVATGLGGPGVFLCGLCGFIFLDHFSFFHRTFDTTF